MKGMSDADLARAVLAGGEGAWGELIARTSGAVLATARRWFAPAEAADEAERFFAALKAGEPAALARYRGAAALAAFLALAADHVFGERMAAIFRADSGRGWPIFERRFAEAARKAIRRRLGATLDSAGSGPLGTLDDLMQDFRVHLMEDGCRRILAYRGGELGMAGFLLGGVLPRWCVDRLRTPELGGRWRAPDAVAALGENAVLLFRALDRDRLGEREARGRFADLPEAEWRALWDAVHKAAIPGRASRPVFASLDAQPEDGAESGAPALQIRDERPDPERASIDAQTSRRLAEGIARLPAEDRDVLGWWLDEVAWPEIARRLGKPLTEARRVKERALRRLQAHLREEVAS
jgi:DNA-directed RNA polymerase specialized sigma24 family protein